MLLKVTRNAIPTVRFQEGARVFAAQEMIEYLGPMLLDRALSTNTKKGDLSIGIGFTKSLKPKEEISS